MIEIKKYFLTIEDTKIIYSKMKELKISQRTMAERLNLEGHSNIGDYLRGKYAISEHLILEIQKMLGIKLPIEHDITISQKHNSIKYYIR